MNVKVFNLVSNLVSLIVTILTILVLFIGSNVTAQTTLNPTTQEIENFFDPQYRKIAECVRKAYTQNNGNRIAGFPTKSIAIIVAYDTNKIKDKIKECPNLDVNIISDDDLVRVVSCLDEIELRPGVGWNQAKQDRLKQCIRATQNTFGIHRQAFVDCVIRKKFNPQTKYLNKEDKDLPSRVEELCVEEQNKAFVFPKNIKNNELPYYSALIYCLDHNQSQPKLLDSGYWDWEKDGHATELAPKIIPGLLEGGPNCPWVIQEFSQLKMTNPRDLGISDFGIGGGGKIDRIK